MSGLLHWRSAKPARLAIAAALCLSQWPAPVSAGPREDAAAAFARCDLIKDNAAWLACHESATAQMRAALSGAMPPPAAGMAGAGVGQNFGAAEHFRQTPTKRAPRKLVARVENLSFSKSGYFTVELDNGQWWRQIDGDTNYARFRSPPKRNVITIERGFLGSYNLHIQGVSMGYKVDRIR